MPWILDSALQYVGFEISVLTGLEHLEGQTVDIYSVTYPGGGESVIETWSDVVRNGQVDARGLVNEAVVGLPINARARLLSHGIETLDQSIFGRNTRVDALLISFFLSRAVIARSGNASNAFEDMINNVIADGAGAVQSELADWFLANRSAGPEDEIQLLRDMNDTMNEYYPLFTGNVRLPMADLWEGGGEVEFYSTEPHPCTIRGVTTMIDREPGQSRKRGG